MNEGRSRGGGRVIRMKLITRAYVRANPDTLFVFGDNMEQRGYGGQAKEMRGEPNVVGVPTKRSPSRDEGAYFSDAMWWHDPTIKAAIDEAFQTLVMALKAGKDVVIPADGLGTGKAELPSRAPDIYSYIEGCIFVLGAWARGDIDAE
jgi:hypothetical protein